jgi:hypothetical protein
MFTSSPHDACSVSLCIILFCENFVSGPHIYLLLHCQILATTGTGKREALLRFKEHIATNIIKTIDHISVGRRSVMGRRWSVGDGASVVGRSRGVGRRSRRRGGANPLASAPLLIGLMLGFVAALRAR